MPPFSNAFQKLSLIGRRRDEAGGRKSQVPRSETPVLPSASLFPTRSKTTLSKNSQSKCAPVPNSFVTSELNRGPCTKKPTMLDEDCKPAGDCESINTFLRPENLLLGDPHVNMDRTKPYLVENTLVREIPLRDTMKILNDRELLCLHWVIGESVERHAERTARYFANLFRRKELTDVIIYVGNHKIKCHKLVLAAFSPRFHKQFVVERPEKMLTPEVCVDVSQLRTRALLRCIEFMYKGSTEIHHHNAVDVLNVAQSLKIFSLAQICKDKLRSLHSSNLAPKPPRDKEADLVRMDEETKLKRTKDISSDESLKRSLYEEKEVKLESSGEELGKEEEVKAVANGPIDFYKIAGQSTFLAWPIETVEALFNNNDIRINSELDVVEAMIRWIQFRPEQRKAFAERLLDCVRFVHTTSNEMLNCKRLIPELFDLGPLRTRMAKAKWTKDLLERGVAAVDVVIPGCRVNRDPCQTQKKRRPFCFSQISTQHLNFPL